MPVEIVFLLFFSVALFVMGIALLAQNRSVLRRAHRSRSWPCVTGIVQGSHVEKIAVDREYTSYTANVMYEYEVDGQMYQSCCVYFGDVAGLALPIFPRRLVRKYPAGRRVKVFFDPSNPKSSTLKPGINRHVIYQLMAGVVLIGAGIAFLLIFFL